MAVPAPFGFRIGIAPRAVRMVRTSGRVRTPPVARICVDGGRSPIARDSEVIMGDVPTLHVENASDYISQYLSLSCS